MDTISTREPKKTIVIDAEDTAAPYHKRPIGRTGSNEKDTENA